VLNVSQTLLYCYDTYSVAAKLKNYPINSLVKSNQFDCFAITYSVLEGGHISPLDSYEQALEHECCFPVVLCDS